MIPPRSDELLRLLERAARAGDPAAHVRLEREKQRRGLIVVEAPPPPAPPTPEPRSEGMPAFQVAQVSLTFVGMLVFGVAALVALAGQVRLVEVEARVHGARAETVRRTVVSGTIRPSYTVEERVWFVEVSFVDRKGVTRFTTVEMKFRPATKTLAILYDPEDPGSVTLGRSTLAMVVEAVSGAFCSLLGALGLLVIVSIAWGRR